jgi:uncharacterized damage-inducible protein DinB
VLEHLRRLFAYNRWANGEVARALATAETPRAVRLLAHVAGAERLWLARLRHESSPLAVWPELTLAECTAHLHDQAAAWDACLQAWSPEDLTGAVAYVNSKGEPWTSTVADILTHVVFHSAYHRGQMATEVRAAGGVPAYTDFIHCVREGFLE